MTLETSNLLHVYTTIDLDNKQHQRGLGQIYVTFIMSSPALSRFGTFHWRDKSPL